MYPRSSLSSGSSSPENEPPIKAFKTERERDYSSAPPSKLTDLLIKEELEGQQTRRLLNAALSQLDLSSQRATDLAIERQKVKSYLAETIKMSQASADAEEKILKAQMQAETYKIQLQQAHKEAERTQLLLKQLEAQREHAEKSATKAKELARRLKEEKAVVVAREGGRREGFEEGLRRGRLIALAHEDATRRLTFPRLAIEDGTAFVGEVPTDSTRSRRRRKDTERSEKKAGTRNSSDTQRRRRKSSERRHRESSERRHRESSERRHRESSERRRYRESLPQVVRASSQGDSPLPQGRTGAAATPSSPNLPPPSPARAAQPPQSQSIPPAVVPRSMVPDSVPLQPQRVPSGNSPLAAQPSTLQNPGIAQSDFILPPSLSRNSPEPPYNTPPTPEPRIPQVVVEPVAAPAVPPPSISYLAMPPPPAQPPAPPAPLPLSSFAPSDTSQPRIQITRSSPDILNSPASTSMTGLSSQLGSHLLSFPGGNTSGRDERPGYVRGLTSIPEDVSVSSPRTGTPSGAWPQQEPQQRDQPRLNTRRSVEEWRNSTELAGPSAGFENPSVPAPSADLTSNQYLQPPDLADRLQRRPSNGSGHSIEFEIVPPSRPSSLVMGDEDQHSAFLSPNHAPEAVSQAPDPTEPPVIPSHTGYTSPIGAPYPNQPEIPVFEPHQLPPGFVPHVMTNHDGSVVDLRAGKAISTPSISSNSPYPPATSRQPTPSAPYSHPFPPPAAIAGPSNNGPYPPSMSRQSTPGAPYSHPPPAATAGPSNNGPYPPSMSRQATLSVPYPYPFPPPTTIAGPSMDELTSTFGSFSLSASQARPAPKGILVNGPRPPQPAYPTQPPPGITFSRSLSDIPGVAMTSPESNVSSPRRRRMSLHAGKTPAVNYQMLPPGSYAGSRSSTPGGTSPMVFARPPPPRSETSSVASHRSHGNGFISPMMTMPEPHLNPNHLFVPPMTMPEPNVNPPFVPQMPEPVIPGTDDDDDSDNESYEPDPMTLANTQFNARGSGWSNPGMPMPYR